ncbi:MAG: hypothetical protein JWL81_963 [Verrucomicrobiales bacterium]|nr:hypothetical protein [Verrucomicrobiales bacterium]
MPSAISTPIQTGSRITAFSRSHACTAPSRIVWFHKGSGAVSSQKSSDPAESPAKSPLKFPAENIGSAGPLYSTPKFARANVESIIDMEGRGNSKVAFPKLHGSFITRALSDSAAVNGSSPLQNLPRGQLATGHGEETGPSFGRGKIRGDQNLGLHAIRHR